MSKEGGEAVKEFGGWGDGEFGDGEAGGGEDVGVGVG